MTVAAAAVAAAAVRRVGRHRADTGGEEGNDIALRVSWRASTAFTRKPTTPPPSTPLFPRRHSSNPFEIDRSTGDRSISSLLVRSRPFSRREFRRSAMRPRERTKPREAAALLSYPVVCLKNYQLSAFASPLYC